ncbi:MAG: hypothetical protein HOV97_29685 [Nonomuraea sp.]|nr:hypothetical protein [Nonomuraea sp.]
MTTSDTAGLLGLSRLVATVPGRSFGDGPGAQLLADLVTKMTAATTNLPFDGPAADDYGPYNAALSIALKAATDNGDAVRLALSGPGGLTLATQLLEGATPVSETVGAYVTTVTDPGWAKLTDAGAIAEFLDAGVMAARGADSTTMQSMQAALNVVKATAAFSAWNPSNDQHAYEVGKLPDSITASLRNYATANMYDLAQSSMDSRTEAVQSDAGIPGSPLTFIVKRSDAETFLKVALRNPNDAMAYQTLVEGKYSEAVRNAIQFGPFYDTTDGYANLAASAQQIIDGQSIDAAKQIDARNTNHQLIANMLGGAFGNAPGPVGLGISQSLEGLMQPTIGGGAGWIGRFFDTSHAAQAQLDAHQSDINLEDHSKLLATQGAYQAGALVVVHDLTDVRHVPAGAAPNGPDMISADGAVRDNATFQTWWKNGENVPLGPGGQKLSDFAAKIQNAMAIHS